MQCDLTLVSLTYDEDTGGWLATFGISRSHEAQAIGNLFGTTVAVDVPGPQRVRVLPMRIHGDHEARDHVRAEPVEMAPSCDEVGE